MLAIEAKNTETILTIDHISSEAKLIESLPSGPAAVIPEDNQYTVEELIKKKVVTVGKGKRRKRVTKYFVKWEGWEKEFNSWVEEENIDEALVAAFNSPSSTGSGSDLQDHTA
jgi:hypothetical protein